MPSAVVPNKLCTASIHEPTCSLFVPERPLRAFPSTVEEHLYTPHDEECHHNWVSRPLNELNEAQSLRCGEWNPQVPPFRSLGLPWFTPGCRACNNLIAIAQENAWRSHGSNTF